MTAGLLAEWRALSQFLAAPRRMPRRHAGGLAWVARSVGFAATVLVINITLAAMVLGPMAGWAGIHEELPDSLTLRFALLAGLFAPLAEELLVRAGLRRLGYTLFVGPALIFYAFSPGGTLWNVAAAALDGALAAGYLLQYVRWHNPAARMASSRCFIRHYGWVYWGYVVAFALAHIGNYSWSSTRGSMFVAAMVLPQLLMGTVAGYLRLRDGLRSSLMLHFLNNAVALLLWQQL